MDKEENMETAQIEKESKTRIDWNMWDALISVALVAFIIAVPLGGIEYSNGRFNTRSNAHSIVLDVCIIGPTVVILAIAFVIVSAVQLLCNLKRSARKRYTNRKRAIRIAQIAIQIVFVTSFIISVFAPVEIPLWQPGYKPFTYGFRERIRSEVDIEEIRDWLKTLSEEDCAGEHIVLSTDSSPSERRWSDSLEWPKSLTVFRPHYARLDRDENGNPKVGLTWGRPFGHWGVAIGMEDMEIP